MSKSAINTSGFAQAGDLKLHYHELGSGPALMMIHGGGPGAAGWSNYSRNVEALAKKFRLIIPDLPGFGDSDKPIIEGSVYKFYADALRNLLDKLKVESAHIIGNSLGGAAALKLAIDTPERVDKLVLMGPGGGLQLFTPRPSEGVKHLFKYYEGEGPTRKKLTEFLSCMVHDPLMITEEILEERLQSSIKRGVKEAWIFNKARPPVLEELWREYNKVSQPTLIIWGRDDRTLTIDNAWAMLNQIPDVQLHVFGKTGHWVQWERPAEFNTLVSGFLAAK